MRQFRPPFIPVLVCLAASLLVWVTAVAQEAKIEVLTTKTGVRYGLWPKKPSSPAPTLFILANTIEETLNSAHFRESGNQLAKEGYACVSVDLPCHGPEQRPGEPGGILGWRFRGERGDNFVAEATQRLSAVLDELIATGVADKDKIAVCGTSRGGFMALHFAAVDARVRCVASFAQVTDLTVLREFQNLENRDLIDSLALPKLADRLLGRPIWLVIGDRDERVNTDDVIKFARLITAESLKAGRPALVELHVLPEPRGHSVPAGAPDQAAVWIHRSLTP